MNMGQLTGHLTLLAILPGLAACSKMGGNSGQDPNVDYYTCAMHPSVKSQDAKANNSHTRGLYAIYAQSLRSGSEISAASHTSGIAVNGNRHHD